MDRRYAGSKMSALPHAPESKGDGVASPPARILVVDDHPTFRRGLASTIAEHADLTVCGEAEDAQKALEAMRRLKPDVAIVDISLPGANGIELIKQMAAEQPDLAFLVLSMHDETYFALRALRAGAKGYVMKAEAPSEIIAAIRKIRRGDLYVSPRLGDRLIFRAIQSLEEGMGSLVDRFSDREFEVFQLLGKGLGTREIAETLHLSAKTVETHRAHLKEKLGCKGANEVVRFAIDWVTKETG
jgi:DNA-binding NarL/FixJ family response regulator